MYLNSHIFQDVALHVTNAGRCLEFTATGSTSAGRYQQRVDYAFTLPLSGQVEVFGLILLQKFYLKK
jgi:hypothetical protein